MAGTILGCGYEVYGYRGISRGYGTLGQLSGRSDEPVAIRLELDKVPDAVFTGSDQLAAGLLLFAGLARIAVPGELAIVGFDDQSLSEALGLTTVYQPTRKMGRKAAELLHKLIETEERGGRAPVERYRVMHTLRARATS